MGKYRSVIWGVTWHHGGFYETISNVPNARNNPIDNRMFSGY